MLRYKLARANCEFWQCRTNHAQNRISMSNIHTWSFITTKSILIRSQGPNDSSAHERIFNGHSATLRSSVFDTLAIRRVHTVLLFCDCSIFGWLNLQTFPSRFRVETRSKHPQISPLRLSEWFIFNLFYHFLAKRLKFYKNWKTSRCFTCQLDGFLSGLKENGSIHF